MDVVASFQELFFGLFDVLSNPQRACLGMLLWSLWGRRNVKVWDENLEEVSHVIGHAFQALQDWEAARVFEHQCYAGSLSSPCHVWTKSSLGLLKYNLDAGFTKDLGISSMGVA